MSNNVQKWRKAAFIHMDKKNTALKELDTLRTDHALLKNQYDDMYFNFWIAVFAIWVWYVICVFLALKIKL